MDDIRVYLRHLQSCSMEEQKQVLGVGGVIITAQMHVYVEGVQVKCHKQATIATNVMTGVKVSLSNVVGNIQKRHFENYVKLASAVGRSKYIQLRVR